MELNLEHEDDKHRTFDGNFLEQLDQIRADGRRPMNIADILQRRLDILESDTKDSVKQNWVNNSFITCHGVQYDAPEEIWVYNRGDMRIKPYSVELVNNVLSILDHPVPIMWGGALMPSRWDDSPVVRAQYYHTLIDERSIECDLNVTEVLRNPYWARLSGSLELLEKYAKATFLYSGENVGMKIQITPGGVTPLPQVRLLGITGMNSGSRLYAKGRGLDCAPIVGVREQEIL